MYHEYDMLTDNSTLPVDELCPVCRLNEHKRGGCKEEMLVNTIEILNITFLKDTTYLNITFEKMISQLLEPP